MAIIPGMVTKPKPLSEQLRDAVLEADISRYRIAKETGVTEAALSRFVNGVSGLSLESIDMIGECLGMRVVTAPLEPVKETPNMAKKKKSGRKKFVGQARRGTLQAVDVRIARAQKALNLKKEPNITRAKTALTNARKELREACDLPEIDD